MSQSVKHTKDSRLQIRVAPADLECLARRMKRAGLNPARDSSRYIRNLLRSQDDMHFVSDAQMELLKYHFTNFARVGGLLNQTVYNLNVERLKFMEGEVDAVALNPKELEKLIRDVQKEVVEAKKAILKLCDQRVS